MSDTTQSNDKRPRRYRDSHVIHVTEGDNTIRPSRVKTPPHLLRNPQPTQDAPTEPPAEPQGDNVSDAS